MSSTTGNETYYNVYEYLTTGTILNSSFMSKNKAFDYVNRFCEAASNVYIYKTKLIKHFASRTSSTEHTSESVSFSHNIETLIAAAELDEYDEDYDPAQDGDNDEDPLEYYEGDYYDLKGLRFDDYGKGFLLKPKSSTSFIGDPYLMNGWWNPSLKGWFFKREFYGDLISAGARYIGSNPPVEGSAANPIVVHGSDSEDQTSTTELDLSGLFFEDHGKGYLLNPLNDTPFRGQKYLLNGWWMPSLHGWFFRRQFYDELLEHGATYTGDDATATAAAMQSTNVASDFDISNLRFRNYGKGFILKPKSNTSFSGEPYLLGGFWNTSLNGWIFRRNSDTYNQLLALGAAYEGDGSRYKSQSASSSMKSSSPGTTCGPSPFEIKRNLSGFIVKPYGKGLVAKCAKANLLYRDMTPYLLGNLGFWNKSTGGWFFQNQYLQSLVDLGAKPVGMSSRSIPEASTFDYVCADSQFY
jgi:hypothetical protein